MPTLSLINKTSKSNNQKITTMVYSIKISCDTKCGSNSYTCKSKTFNVETSLEMALVFNIVEMCRKQNYECTICRNKECEPSIPLGEALEEISNLRFYKVEVSYEQIEHHRQLSPIVFPAPIEVLRCWSPENVDITFFELECSDLVNINFNALKREFEDRGLDLHKSKTEGVWYTHNDVDITTSNNGFNLNIVKAVVECRRNEKKIELQKRK